LRLQTFPDGYQIAGGHTEAQRQLGNAVPALMAEVLGRAIRKQLLDSPLSTALQLMPPKRTLPEPEPIQSVPEEFLVHEAEHKSHPGTGKGPKGKEARQLVVGASDNTNRCYDPGIMRG
jgi:DNA (cytosine-5)-methyltransferase 1